PTASLRSGIYTLSLHDALPISKGDVELVPRQRGAQLQVDPAVLGVRAQHRIGTVQQGGAGGVLLQAGVAQPGRVTDLDLHHAVGQVAVRAAVDQVLDHVQLRTGRQLDAVAQVPGAVFRVGRADEDQAHRVAAP